MNEMLKLSLGEGSTILMLVGDITQQDTDAIVNAANSSLMGGGGVDGAIHRAGGPTIVEECKRIVAAQGPLPPGEAVSTTGGKLKAAFVIHTVGPVWYGGDRGEAETLALCYRRAIETADTLHLTSVAFPAISTGAYGYPVQEAAKVAVRATVEALSEARRVRDVRFVLFDHHAFDTFARVTEAFVQSARDTWRYRLDRIRGLKDNHA